MNEIEVELGPTQETLLIPLLGRAMETKKGGRLLSDPKAVEIVESLDYDFSKWGSSARGVCIRARIFDGQVRRFLAAHPRGTIVEIGAGLNTRFERLDNGQAQWFELDLPDSMTLRRRFFEDHERRTMHAGSVLDSDWLDAVAELPGPYCFVSEAVVIYLDSPDVQRAMQAIATRFPGAWLVMDTTPTKAVQLQGKNALMKVMSKDSWFRWACDDPAALQSWGLVLDQSVSFADVAPDIRKDMPWPLRLIFGLTPRSLLRSMGGGYRMNQFTLKAPSDAGKRSIEEERSRRA
ncbi:MAG: class I SAM-dependent methyltransferase [Myxococcota bacterium]